MKKHCQHAVSLSLRWPGNAGQLWLQVFRGCMPRCGISIARRREQTVLNFAAQIATSPSTLCLRKPDAERAGQCPWHLQPRVACPWFLHHSHGHLACQHAVLSGAITKEHHAIPEGTSVRISMQLVLTHATADKCAYIAAVFCNVGTDTALQHENLKTTYHKQSSV